MCAKYKLFQTTYEEKQSGSLWLEKGNLRTDSDGTLPNALYQFVLHLRLDLFVNWSDALDNLETGGFRGHLTLPFWQGEDGEGHLLF